MTDWCRISEDTLSAFVDGELTLRQQRQLACHVAHCARCSQQLGALYAMKSYVHSVEQVDGAVPAGLWPRLRQALDTVDRVARSLPYLPPRPISAWRLPALVAVGVVLIISALYARQLLITRPTTPELLAVAHRSATAHLLPPDPGLGRYQTISTGTPRKPWQPIRSALVRVGGGLGHQQVYLAGPVALSYFSLPDQALGPDNLIAVYQTPRTFYVGTALQLSMVAWREPEGWGVLVADMYREQLLPLAELHARSATFSSGF